MKRIVECCCCHALFEVNDNVDTDNLVCPKCGNKVFIPNNNL